MADKDLAWYKWYPYRSRASWRWTQLTILQRGIFRELYDLAATCEPRGTLCYQDVALTDEQLAKDVGVTLTTFQRFLGRVLSTELRLMIRDPDGILRFPDWKRHQRHTPLRSRQLETERANMGKCGARMGKCGASLEENRPQEEEEEEEEEEEKEEEGEKRGHPSFREWSLSLKNLWTALAEKCPSLSTITKISDERRRHLRARYQSAHFRDNFTAVLTEIAQSSFLLGSNDRNWVVTFDWLVKNDGNYLKVLEGKFKDAPTVRKKRHAGY